ncbi:DUF1168-domain-containing protein [Ceraceosorus guamensis]|uniref:DUF1168-domain-containing protein n=1 Tax=Ceraceosorus guamensis TaxID=1522189 RepID=A0A316VWY1_9BASI|nr:DUF1168-domain-containing protein [Ceraceosorus guamensis]PWN42126.1 DUF1168-domain-containing protein [Ceraceosorus guamensis]
MAPSRAPINGGPNASSPPVAERIRPQTASEKQAAHLEKLLKDPDRPVHIPKPAKEKELRPPREMMKNVSGSSAGAGSGEFHVYKHARRREYERVRLMEEKEAKSKEAAAFEAQQAALEAESEAKTSKNRAKRDKKKARAAAAAAAAAAATLGLEGGSSKSASQIGGALDADAEGTAEREDAQEVREEGEEEREKKKRRIARPVEGADVAFKRPGVQSDEE